MAFTAKTADRFSFGIIYVLIGIFTLWVGFRAINSGLEIRFLKNYLLQWDIGLQAYSAQQHPWPVFADDNHVAYMDALTRRMSSAGIDLPRSNTRHAYRYHIERWAGRTEKIFILGLPDRLMLYGLSREFTQRIERAVDRHPDLDGGRFQGYPGKDKMTYIGNWKL